MKNVKWFYLLEGLSCFIFFYGSTGLLYWDEYQKIVVPIRSLQSSGSDDDIAIWINGSICVLAFISMLFTTHSPGKSIVIFVIALGLQIFSVLLIEIGSIYWTIVSGGNLYLATALLSQIIIIGISIKQFLVMLKR